MTDPRRVRAGDAERRAAADALAEHYTAGRLSTGEYDERVAQAFAATYTDEFSSLFTDLPSGPVNRSPRADPFVGGPTGRDRWGSSDPGGGHDDTQRSGPFDRGGPWNNRHRGGRGFTGPRGSDGPPVVAIVFAVIAFFVVAGVLIAVARFLLPLLVIGLVIWIVSQRRGGPPRSRRAFGPNGNRRW